MSDISKHFLLKDTLNEFCKNSKSFAESLENRSEGLSIENEELKGTLYSFSKNDESYSCFIGRNEEHFKEKSINENFPLIYFYNKSFSEKSFSHKKSIEHLIGILPYWNFSSLEELDKFKTNKSVYEGLLNLYNIIVETNIYNFPWLNIIKNMTYIKEDFKNILSFAFEGANEKTLKNILSLYDKEIDEFFYKLDFLLAFLKKSFLELNNLEEYTEYEEYPYLYFEIGGKEYHLISKDQWGYYIEKDNSTLKFYSIDLWHTDMGEFRKSSASVCYDWVLHNKEIFVNQIKKNKPVIEIYNNKVIKDYNYDITFNAFLFMFLMNAEVFLNCVNVKKDLFIDNEYDFYSKDYGYNSKIELLAWTFLGGNDWEWKSGKIKIPNKLFGYEVFDMPLPSNRSDSILPYLDLSFEKTTLLETAPKDIAEDLKPIILDAYNCLKNNIFPNIKYKDKDLLRIKNKLKKNKII